MKKKYAVVNLTERNGEYEYDFHSLIERDVDSDLKQEAEEVVQTWFGGDEVLEELSDGVYWDECMVRTISLRSVKEVTKQEFEILRRYV